MILIKRRFNAADMKEGVTLVTPDSFSSVKSWAGKSVDGDEYYVKKAVKLGANPVQKPKKKASKKAD